MFFLHKCAQCGKRQSRGKFIKYYNKETKRDDYYDICHDCLPLSEKEQRHILRQLDIPYSTYFWNKVAENAETARYRPEIRTLIYYADIINSTDAHRFHYEDGRHLDKYPLMIVPLLESKRR